MFYVEGSKNTVLLHLSKQELEGGLLVFVAPHPVKAGSVDESCVFCGDKGQRCVVSRGADEDKVAVRGRSEKFPEYQSSAPSPSSFSYGRSSPCTLLKDKSSTFSLSWVSPGQTREGGKGPSLSHWYWRSWLWVSGQAGHAGMGAQSWLACLTSSRHR